MVENTTINDLPDDVLYATLAVYLIELCQGGTRDPKTLSELVMAGCGRATARANDAERLCLKLYERLNYIASEPWLPDPSGRSIPGDADWAKWDEWNRRDPGGVTADEQKAIEAMRGRQKA